MYRCNLPIFVRIISNLSQSYQVTSGISLASVENTVVSSTAENISSTLLSQGVIEAGDFSTTGNIVIVAGNDVNNQGSNITSQVLLFLRRRVVI